MYMLRAKFELGKSTGFVVQTFDLSFKQSICGLSMCSVMKYLLAVAMCMFSE